MTECWLGVYFPQLQLQYQAWSLQSTTVAPATSVFAGLPPLALYDTAAKQLHSVSPNAAARGVKSGMSQTTAQALLPDLVLLSLQEVDCEALQHWLCQWNYDFSARIWPPLLQQEPLNSDAGSAVNWPTETLVLEMGSMLRLFGSQSRFMESYHQRCQCYGLHYALALARYPLHAALLAKGVKASTPTALGMNRVSTPRQTRNRLLAVPWQLPSENQVTESHAEYQTQAVPATVITTQLPSQLPLQALPLDDKTQQRLLAMGINCWQQLQSLPRPELGKRFGQPLLTLLLQLEGRLSYSRKAYHLPPIFRLKRLLLHDVSYIQGVMFPLAPMFAQLATYLRVRQLAVQQLQLTLFFRSNNIAPMILRIDYPLGEFRQAGLLQLCRLQLERLTLPQPVIELELQVRHFIAQQLQNGVLSKTSHEQQPFPELLARLQARLGKERVRQLCYQASPLPEQASHSQPIQQWPPQPAKLPVPVMALRPLWLLAEPQPLSVDDVDILRGPERIVSPWFTDNFPARDYFLARHRQGGYCWVFRSQGQLLLHGWMS
ncbi:hypothetical protein PY479_16050 [Shewanella sp. A32]|uniref:hypothetical protein n=1 Tax=Shewanella sp. A32 TaxID=3031327 RepID=UPI0023B8E3F7|nr:hypothetical protein [Shewanella sp. A32]MDF0535782.1 hypothetical protein [Shewanella sp. A32]